MNNNEEWITVNGTHILVKEGEKKSAHTDSTSGLKL